MGMTLWRWIAGVAVGCAAIAAMLLPFPPTTPRTWATNAPAPLLGEMRKLTAAAGEAYAGVRAYRAAQALDRWTSVSRGADTTLIRLDRSVPPNVAATVRATVAEQWAGLATPVSGADAEVFVFVDSTSIPRAADSLGSRRLLEPRRFVDVAFALPQATDGKRCVALVRLRGSSPAHLNALGNQSLVGTCGFFAAFGSPGDRVRTWLAATGYRFARRSDWSVARPPATDVTSLYSLSESAGECLTGSRAGCAAALWTNASPNNVGPGSVGRLAWVLDPTVLTSARNAAMRSTTLGSAEDQLLADAARSLGAERFRQFWRASSAPDTAFLAAAGVGLDEWTQQWLSRTYGAAPSRPSVRMRDLFWLTVAAPLGLLIAARPRQRVLR